MSESQALPHQVAELEELVGLILDTARTLGADAAECAVSSDTGLSVTVRMRDVETLEFHKDQGVGITLYAEGRKGAATTSDLSPRALREATEAAWRIARHTQADSCAGLPPAERMARDWPDLDLDHPWVLDAEQAMALAMETEAAALDFDPRISNSDGASVNTYRGAAVYGNSHGFVGGYVATRHSLSCSVIASDEAGAMQRDYWYSVSRVPEELDSAEAVGRRAGERTLRRLGARKLATGTMPVLFAPEVARGLIGHFVSAVRGPSLYRKASFLLDALGERIFPAGLHLHEQPHLPRALGSAPFDAEGVATQPRDLVRDGVLEGYVLDHYSACRLGMETTGNAGGVRNLTVEPTTAENLEGLCRRMGRGLLVTELIGHGVNIVTGDYSRGAAGFLVE
ncbi:MAG: metalloprotease PmbA, partial [Gammaproteobacteria bacterium]